MATVCFYCCSRAADCTAGASITALAASGRCCRSGCIPIRRSPINSITPPQLLEVLRRIESRGVVETAHRALENCSQVFRYAVAIGKTTHNPARDLKDALRRPKPKHFPAITDPARFGQML